MNQLFSAILFAAWLIRFLERTLFHTHLWQLKEYRWDRYKAHVLTRQGLGTLFHPWFLFGCTLFLLLLAPPSLGSYPATLQQIVVMYATIAWILISAVSSIARPFRHQFQRPDLTFRASIIIGGVIALYSTFLYGARVSQPAALPLSLLLVPTVTTLFVMLSSIPATFFKKRTIEEAKQKMASLQNLKVIGITGSYGKSSTKEFLGQILEKKYKVVRTPKNKNSEMGVAETILKDVTPEHEMFIVEMGAYRQGEIKAICDIVHPTIGVITAVGEQHVSLFGSLEAIQQTKYELIESLPEDGTAVFNADMRSTRTLAERTTKPTKTYSLDRPADVRASSVVVQPERVSFSVQIGNNKQHMIAPLLGGFQVSNVLAAITVAHTLGMTLADIADAVATLTPPQHTMTPHHHASGALIIDDAYSANPDGVIGALNHMKIIPRTYKVLVMMPMIELGSIAKDAHRRVGECAGEVCDLIIMTRSDYARVLRSASGLPKEKVFVLSSPSAIVHALAPYRNANSVILLENRIPLSVVKALTERRV